MKFCWMNKVETRQSTRYAEYPAALRVIFSKKQKNPFFKQRVWDELCVSKPSTVGWKVSKKSISS